MRKITVLRDGWKFLKSDVSEAQAAALFGQGESISLPHTWNVVDGQDGDLLTGRTDGGRLVRLPGDLTLLGRFIPVTITGSTTWSLTGEPMNNE